MRRIFSCAYLLFLLAALAVLAGCSGNRLDMVADELTALVNAERNLLGLQVLQPNKAAQKVALEKAKEMEELGYFGHESPLQGDVVAQFEVWGHVQMPRDALALGENLAMARGIAEKDITADLFLQGWLESDGHRNNLLYPDFNGQGIALFPGKDGKVYAVQELIQTP